MRLSYESLPVVYQKAMFSISASCLLNLCLNENDVCTLAAAHLINFLAVD